MKFYALTYDFVAVRDVSGGDQQWSKLLITLGGERATLLSHVTTLR